MTIPVRAQNFEPQRLPRQRNPDWQIKTLSEILKLEYGKPLAKSDRSQNGKYFVYGANGIKDKSNEFHWSKPSIIVGRKGSAGEITLVKEKFLAS